MNTSQKVNMLKVSFVLTYLLFVLTAVKAWSCPSKECGEIPFSTQIIQYELQDNCYQVQLEVSNNTGARYELSHANFYFSCGTIDNISNSEGWPIETIKWHNKPVGFKVDEIKNFGKDPAFNSFTIEFTYCPAEQKEEDFEYYCQPKVEYKAGQCLYLEKLDANPNDETDPAVEDLLYEISAISPTCSGSDGMIEVTITQGTEPFEVVWDNGAVGTLIDGLNAGTYTYTITDGNGSEEIGEVILQSPGDINIDGTVVQPSCNGNSSGSISLNVSGGEEPYTILWNSEAVSSSITDLGAGAYSVKVTDARGCIADATFQLLNQNAITLSAEVQQPSCQEGTLGSIALSASGGTEPYTYSWNNGMTGSALVDLSDGYYTATITDAAGCESSRTFAIRTEIGIEATSIVTNTNCFNEPVGAIDLSIVGGTQPITVEWSNGTLDEDLTDVTSGYYTATITDANGCQITHRAYVRVDNIIISYDDIVVPTCHGGDGAIYISASNGTEPYTFTWYDENGNEVANTDDVENLSSGKYTLEVSDATGCSLEKIINLQASPLYLSHEVISDVCTGAQTIVVEASGGTPEYNFEWSDGSTGNTIYGAQPGAYSVTVTDASGCLETQEISIEESTTTLACAIDELISDVMCGSVSNIMSSAITEADYYNWTLSSTDGSWEITSAANQSSIEFTAGNSGSSGTLSLTLGYNDGCEISCDKTIDVCVDNPDTDNPDTDNPDTDNPDMDNPDNSDNPDSGDDTTDNGDGSNPDNPDDNGNTGGDNPDDGSDNPDGGMDNPDDNTGNPDDNDGENPNQGPAAKECDECFYTNPISIIEENGVYAYSIEVTYSDCNYDLSHLTIEIPDCFYIMDYSNSMGWKMEEIKNDPTTGISGLKIDDIPAFGKDENVTSFMIHMELTSDDDDCFEDLKCFAPVIAYKAATCVYEEQTEGNCAIVKEEDSVVTYPNPTCDYVHINKHKWDRDASYTADLVGFYGEKVKRYYFSMGSARDFDIDMSQCKQGTYILQIKGSNGDCSTHRIVKY